MTSDYVSRTLRIKEIKKSQKRFDLLGVRHELVGDGNELLVIYGLFKSKVSESLKTKTPGLVNDE